MAKRIKLFLSNAMGILFHKFADCPRTCAEMVYASFHDGELFEFEDTNIDRSAERREFRTKFEHELMNLMKGQGVI